MSELTRDSEIRLSAVNVGRVGRLMPGEVASAIAKRPVAEPVAVTRFGLAGDEQADRTHHGGLDKALHHYPAEHYAAWQEELPSRAPLFQVGGFGENLATVGMREGDVCLGDTFRLGTSVVQISQGRQPCAKLNLRFGVPDMVARVHESGRTGWYYRVLEVGRVARDDSLALLDRPHPEWPLTRLWSVLFGTGTDLAGLARLADLPVLSASWRERADRRLSAR